jgi:hypothetical protein
MYFKARNGTYKRVPQIPNRFLDGEVGGMAIYYTSAYHNSKTTAFKPVHPTLLNIRVVISHASACSQVIPHTEQRPASLDRMLFVSDATTPKVSVETPKRHALIQVDTLEMPSTPTNMPSQEGWTRMSKDISSRHSLS